MHPADKGLFTTGRHQAIARDARQPLLPPSLLVATEAEAAVAEAVAVEVVGQQAAPLSNSA